jgi:hypothetical protein
MYCQKYFHVNATDEIAREMIPEKSTLRRPEKTNFGSVSTLKSGHLGGGGLETGIPFTHSIGMQFICEETWREDQQDTKRYRATPQELKTQRSGKQTLV